MITERLARLAERRARRVLILAATIFVVAGALGAGVADRLDPYGADDPDTESVIADKRLEQAGFRETAVVVLVDGVDVRSLAGRGRVEAVARELETDPDVVVSTTPRAWADFVTRPPASRQLQSPEIRLTGAADRVAELVDALDLAPADRA